MTVLITARDDSISNNLKKYAEEKADKLYRFFNGIQIRNRGRIRPVIVQQPDFGGGVVVLVKP